MNGTFLIIGCSGGLGSALVDELLSLKTVNVFGIAPLDAGDIPNFKQWQNSGRFFYKKLNMRRPESVETLKVLSKNFPPEPLIVIYNAAVLKPDVTEDSEIHFQVFEEIKQVGVDGFNYVIRALGPHLVRHGGVLVGISSINAWKPPVLKPKIAYGAAKAYMHMAIRNLRFIWPKNVKLMTFHMGHIGGTKADGIQHIIRPTYPDTAKKIIQILSKKRISQEYFFPFFYKIPYRYIFRLFPDKLYVWLLGIFFRRSG